MHFHISRFKPVRSDESGFFTSGDAKKIAILRTNEMENVIVANNNDILQAFKKKQNTTN